MKIKCSVCDGTGNRISRDEDDMKCYNCGGTGYVDYMVGYSEKTFQNTLDELYNNYKYINATINISKDSSGTYFKITNSDGKIETFKVVDNLLIMKE